MKKNTIKAFTLVEMLIVIVIIGILIASLMPRMQSAQWRARDVARKNDLAQIQTAIITSQQDRGAFPGMKDNEAKKTSADTAGTTWANTWMIVDDMAYNLQTAGMSSVPSDPNGSNINYWLGQYTKDSNAWSVWKYISMVAKRNWVNNAGFVLMAKTEVEWWSNRVVCASGTNAWTLTWGSISSTDDLAKIKTCKTLTQDSEVNNCISNTDDCKYSQTAELRYILLY